MDEDWYQKGLRVRQEVLGKEYVEHSLQESGDFDRDFQHHITEVAWGKIWGRPGLERKTRSMLTLAILVTLGREHELRVHLRGAISNGVTLEEVREVLMHASVYAGVPAALSAFVLAKKQFQEMGLLEK